MEGVVITIEDSTLRSRVESLLAKGDFVESLTAPTVESPFPLWIWHDVMKIWIGDRWKNVGIFRAKDYKETRIGNGLIGLKE